MTIQCSISVTWIWTFGLTIIFDTWYAGVDVCEVRHLCGGRHPVGDLHDLHGGEAVAPQQQDPGQDVGESFKDDDGFVLGEICDKEDEDEDGKVGIGPHRIHIMVNLKFEE